MSLADKIFAKYPELKVEDFHPMMGTILLQDDSDGQGAYIAKWEHPTFERPSDAELGITRKEVLELQAVVEAPAIEAAPIDETQKKSLLERLGF